MTAKILEFPMKTKKKVPSSKKIKKRARPKSQLTLMNLKVSRKDRELIEQRARRFAGGNISAWLRESGMSYTPAKRKAA